MQPDEPFCYLTTTGRRTGRPHTIEIWFAADGQTLYLMAGGREQTDWVRNLLADPAVDVRIGEVVHQGTARVPEGSDEDALARRLLLAKYQKDDELESWGRTALPVAIDLASGAA